MASWFSSWRQKIKQHPMRSTFVGIACVLGIVLLIGGYFFNWTWTGFGQYTLTNSNFQHEKTLYDWLQLLIIPVALALVAIWFNRRERKNEQRIATDNQQEAALQAYVDRLSELLMKEGLHTSKPEDEVRTVARVRTLTVLRQLNNIRKGYVIQFLLESDLISVDADKCVIDLAGADIREAFFFRADLSEVNLIGAELNFANFSIADLSDADLSEAELIGAEFIRTDLSKATFCDANLCYAKFMEANLSETNFSNADLSRADLSEADLSKTKLNKADLSEAKLIRANFEGANLSGVDLTGAILKGAKVTDEQLNQTKSLEGAIMPDGTKHA